MEHDVGYHESTELKELQLHFRKAIDALQPNYREVIYLKDVCGLETNEVVEVTGLNENNMRVLLSRARAKVKENLLNMYAYESIRK